MLTSIMRELVKCPSAAEKYLSPYAALLYDLNHDGKQEIIACWAGNANTTVLAADGKGEILWCQVFEERELSSEFMTIADLDGDNLPELLLDRLVLDAESGKVIRTDSQLGTIGDLNRDGKMEIVTKDAILNAEFEILKTRSGGASGKDYPILADLNNDGFLEIIHYDSDNLYVYDRDYVLLWTVAIEGIQKVVCGDVNHDEKQEILIGANSETNKLYCYSAGGSLNWVQTSDIKISDMLLADINDDGKIEIIYGDWRVVIQNGETGAVIAEYYCSDIHNDFSRIAIGDVDGDHEAEILGIYSCLDNNIQNKEPEVVLTDIRKEFNRFQPCEILQTSNGILWVPGRGCVSYYDPAQNQAGIIKVPSISSDRVTLELSPGSLDVFNYNAYDRKWVKLGYINPDDLQFTFVGTKVKEVKSLDKFERTLNGKYYFISILNGGRSKTELCVEDLATGEIYSLGVNVRGVLAVVDENNIIVSADPDNSIYLLSLNNMEMVKIYPSAFIQGSFRLSTNAIILYGKELLKYNISTREMVTLISPNKLMAYDGLSFDNLDSDSYWNNFSAVRQDDQSIYYIGYTSTGNTGIYSYNLESGNICKVADLTEYPNVRAMASKDQKVYYILDRVDKIYCYDKETRVEVNYDFPDNILKIVQQKRTYVNQILVSPDNNIYISFYKIDSKNNVGLIGVARFNPVNLNWQWFDINEISPNYKFYFGVSPDELFINDYGTLKAFNPNSGIWRTIDQGSRGILDGMAVDLENQRLYYNINSKLKYLDLLTGNIIDILDISNYVYWREFTIISAQGNKLYFHDTTKHIWEYSLDTCQMIPLFWAEPLDRRNPNINYYYDPYSNQYSVFTPVGNSIFSYDLTPVERVTGNNNIYDETTSTIREETVAVVRIPVRMEAGEVKMITHDFGNLQEPGTYMIRGKLINQIGQKLSESRNTFTVINQDGLGVTTNSEKQFYQPYEEINFTGQILNTSSSMFDSLKMIITRKINGKSSVLKEEDLTLAPGEKKVYYLTANAGELEADQLIESVLLKEGVVVARSQSMLKVVKPRVEILLEAPTYVGNKPFPVMVKLSNVSPYPVTGYITSTALQLSQAVTLAAGETTIITKELLLSSDIKVAVTFNGDTTADCEQMIYFSQSAVISLTLPEKVSAQTRSIPLTITNTSQVELEIPLTLTLFQEDAQIAQEIMGYTLQPGESINGSWPVNLKAGDYRLMYQVFEAAPQKVDFRCLPDYAVDLIAKSTLLAPDELQITININNTGLQNINGEIIITSSFGERTIPVMIEAAGSSSNEVVLTDLPVEAGTYPVKVSFKRANEELASKELLFVREEVAKPIANLELITLPAQLVGGAGQNLTVSCTVKNNGTKNGDGIIELISESIFFADSETINLDPGQEQVVTFTLPLPDDMESGTYQGQILVNGVETKFTYDINGYKLIANATLDKPSYQEGETAKMTLQVSNQGGQDNVPLIVRVKQGDFDETRELDLKDKASLTFDIPVNNFKERIFYGFYHRDSGRSLRLDVCNVYRSLPGLKVALNKERYNAGETVTVQIEAAQEDWLAIAGPGEFHQFEKVTGSKTYSIPLPDSLKTGTYSIWIACAGETLEYKVDVIGHDIRFVSGSLNLGNIQNDEPFNLNLLVTSGESRSYTAVLELVKPDNTVTQLKTEKVNFQKGDNNLTFSGVVNTEQTGIHWLRVKILAGDKVISKNSYAFHSGKEEMLNITTSQTEYFYGTESVNGEIHLYGEGNGTVSLLLDATLVANLPVTLNGSVVIPYNLSGVTVNPGHHTLKAVYQGVSGTTGTVTTKFNYGSGLPDLEVVSVEVGKEPNERGELPVTINLKKSNPLKVENLKVQVKFGADLVAEYLVDQLEGEAATHSRTISWNSAGFSGSGEFTVIVNPDNTVREYNTHNNSANVRVVIPKTPEVNGLPEMTNDPHFVIAGNTTADSLVYLYNDQGVLDFTYADNAGHFSFKEFTLDQGENRLRLKAKGKEGWQSGYSDYFIIKVDSVTPEIEILNIVNDQCFNYDIQPEVFVRENNPAEIRYSLDNQPWSPGTVVTAEGNHHFQVVVTDIAGNQASSDLTFTIDKTRPEVSINNLINGEIYNHEVIPDIQVFDLNLESMEITLNGETYNGETITNDGEYTLVATAYDKAGNVADAMVDFVIDRTAPIVEIVGITDGEKYDRPVIPIINVTDQSIATIIITLDGQPYQSGTEISAVGKHQLIVTATDKVGNVKELSITFTISGGDTIAPVTSIVLEGGETNIINQM